MNGTRTDVEILTLVATELGFLMGVTDPASQVGEVFEEIRRTVKGYNISKAALLSGEAIQTQFLAGPVPHRSRPDLIASSNDTLFTSGSLGRYCQALNSVREAKLRKNPEGIGS